MAQGNNHAKCPKCGEEHAFLVSTVNGSQVVVCKKCSNMFKVEIKKGQFTGRIL